ncbi:MAG: hypothetical protein PHX83_16515 [Acidobacteriia bacterium]|nr:hypothetical protein [Terriglobia bacterium]
MTALPNSIPDRARIVFDALHSAGFTGERCLELPASRLSTLTLLDPWHVFYGLGWLSFSGELSYRVLRQNGERFIQVCPRGQVDPSSESHFYQLPLIVTNPNRDERDKYLRDRLGVIGGKEGFTGSLVHRLSNVLGGGRANPFCEEILSRHSAEILDRVLQIVEAYPDKRIYKNRRALFLALLKRYARHRHPKSQAG